MTRILKVLAAALMLATVAAPGQTQETTRGQITLQNIYTPLVPTASLRGDREFGGNGPIMTVSVDLKVGRGGRAVFATVNFEAREDGGDGSLTRLEPRTFEVWRWKPSDGARFVASIDRPSWSATVRSRPTCGACAGAIDGAFPTVMTGRNPLYPISSVSLIGDTMGDDISTDQNPHGDTSIRAIVFNPVNVRFATRLQGS